MTIKMHLQDSKRSNISKCSVNNFSSDRWGLNVMTGWKILYDVISPYINYLKDLKVEYKTTMTWTWAISISTFQSTRLILFICAKYRVNMRKHVFKIRDIMILYVARNIYHYCHYSHCIFINISYFISFNFMQ